MIYLDNAATSFPKPAAVSAAIARHLACEAVNPGRSGFDLARQAGQSIDQLRTRLAAHFHLPGADSNRVVFTQNATDALNIALQGLCRPRDHIVATVLEHNSVLRPLHEMRKMGIEYDLAPCDERGYCHAQDIEKLLRPETKLVVMTHVSNVLGTVQPVAQVGALCRERGIHFLVDAAQSAGSIPVDMEAMAADLLVFTGHKGLMGPTGCGGLLVGEDIEVRSTRWGGTGVRSAQEGHLEEYPYRLEAGTLNAVGLAGLAAGLAWVEDYEPANPKITLARQFLKGLQDLPKVRIAGLEKGETQWDAAARVPLFPVLVEGMDPARVGMFLDADWDIAVRTGLQCAPLAHRAMGTFDGGTVRVSFGPLNTPEQIDRLLEALASF